MVAREKDSGRSPEENAGVTRTTGVREALRFDETRLAQWMSSHVPGFTGMLAVEQFTGGQSNPTYKLRTPGKHYALRRKPPGQLLKGAHTVDREAQVLQALEKTDYPVAHVHGLCMDDAVIGTPFPSEADYVATYCRRTGREGIPNLDFYIAFNMFRLAAIFHGIKGRLARGTAASAHAREYAAGVGGMAELGWAQARRASLTPSSSNHTAGT
jgi:aminoglycoside phosphotransferase (APT) family kinase protein